MSEKLHLVEPVSAQVTTFANGVRHVCCFHAGEDNRIGAYCFARREGLRIAPCIYAWSDPSKK
jgi:hypothetical protein